MGHSTRIGPAAVSAALLLGCGGGGAGASSSTGGGTCPSAPLITRDVAYETLEGVDPSLTSLDIHTPGFDSACKPAPIVVWVHGGAWAIGDKAAAIEDKVALFNGVGWAVVSVNYRLSPDAPTDDPERVMHPTHTRDVAAAVAWIEAHAAEMHLDATRVALLGHSAGAHLVALVSTDETFLAAHGETLAAIRCTGSFDTEAYDIPAAYADASAMQTAILENAFGTDPAVHEGASPLTHVAAGKGIPPMLIAKRGDAQRQATQQAFHDALVAAGVAATIIDAAGLTHEEVNRRIGAPGDAVMTPPITSFLSGCLDD
jgi:arylformamidase